MQSINRDQPCPLCGQVPIDLAVCTNCLLPTVDTLGNGGLDNLASKYISKVVRHLGSTCYLCDVEPSAHADHIVPKSRGGTDHWSNIAAACERCNLAKSDTEGITDQQARRAAEHQSAVRQVFATLADDESAWLQWFASDIQWMRDELDGDPEVMDADDVHFNLDIETFVEEYPTAPAGIIDRVTEAVLHPNRDTMLVMPMKRTNGDRMFTVVDLGDSNAR